MGAGAPKFNKNAEQWNIEEATKIFDNAIEMSKHEDYDFIGEIARDLGTYRDIFTYLSDKYKELETKHRIILSNLEANCFSHSKKGTIKEATAIINLKANYKWKDRADFTSDEEKIQTTIVDPFALMRENHAINSETKEGT
jgi:hypothetical protein